MISGQKVIKVFCHEAQARAGFDALNEELCGNATQANRFSNILMPVMSNIGNLLYVVIAIVGGAIALGGVGGGLTLGGHRILPPAHPQLYQSREPDLLPSSTAWSWPLAGAGRIFSLLDQTPESDGGYVTLVNARYDHGGNLTEADGRTGIWAWKHPHSDGTITYTKLTGDVRLADVDFGYEPQDGPPRCHPYAEPGQKVAFVAPPARARPPLQTSSTASTTLPTVKSATTASTSTRSERATCAAAWASSSRT